MSLTISTSLISCEGKCCLPMVFSLGLPFMKLVMLLAISMNKTDRTETDTLSCTQKMQGRVSWPLKIFALDFETVDWNGIHVQMLLEGSIKIAKWNLQHCTKFVIYWTWHVPVNLSNGSLFAPLQNIYSKFAWKRQGLEGVHLGIFNRHRKEVMAPFIWDLNDELRWHQLFCKVP